MNSALSLLIAPQKIRIPTGRDSDCRLSLDIKNHLKLYRVIEYEGRQVQDPTRKRSTINLCQHPSFLRTASTQR
jgi:hypothetical protein